MNRDFLYLIGGPVQGAIIGAVLWWLAGGMGGWVQRLPGPLSSVLAWVVIGAVIGLIVGAILCFRRVRHARQMAALAGQWNFHFEPSAGRDQLAPYLGLGLFASDRFGDVTNLMRAKEEDVGVELLDYEFIQRGSESDSHFRQTVVLFADCAQRLPAFELTPRGMTHKLFYHLLGLDGITFEADELMPPADREAIETFRKTYFLSPPMGMMTEMLRAKSGQAGSGADSGGPQAIAGFDAPIRNVFRLPLLVFLAQHPGWSVESDGRHLALWKTNHVVPAEQRLDFVRQAQEVQHAILGASDLPPATGIVAGGLQINPARAVAGMVGGMIGAFAGFAMGGLVGFGLVIAVVSLTKDPPIPAVILLFFGCPIGGAIAGAAMGTHWSRRRKSPL